MVLVTPPAIVIGKPGGKVPGLGDLLAVELGGAVGGRDVSADDAPEQPHLRSIASGRSGPRRGQPVHHSPPGCAEDPSAKPQSGRCPPPVALEAPGVPVRSCGPGPRQDCAGRGAGRGAGFCMPSAAKVRMLSLPPAAADPMPAVSLGNVRVLDRAASSANASAGMARSLDFARPRKGARSLATRPRPLALALLAWCPVSGNRTRGKDAGRGPAHPGDSSEIRSWRR
jgi:hypothetical protein